MRTLSSALFACLALSLACSAIAIGQPAPIARGQASQDPPPAVPAMRAPGISANDDRVRVDVNKMPWRAMGKVQTNLGGSCTGTLIAPRLVLTAGHCIYQQNLRALLPVSSLHFLAGFKSGAFAGQAQVIRFEHAPGLLAFLRGETKEPQHDWVVMVLDQPLGEQFGFLPLATTPLPVGKKLQTAGYGQDHRLLLLADLDCHVRPLPFAVAHMIAHDCEITKGNSGGALLVQQDGEWRVAGVVQGWLGSADRKIRASVAVDVSVLRDKIGQWQQ